MLLVTTSYTAMFTVLSDGVVPPIVMFTVLAALAAVMVLVANVLLADSTPAELTARTAKCQVPAPSEPIVVLVAVGPLTALLCDRAVELVPKSTL